MAQSTILKTSPTVSQAEYRDLYMKGHIITYRIQGTAQPVFPALKDAFTTREDPPDVEFREFSPFAKAFYTPREALKRREKPVVDQPKPVPNNDQPKSVFIPDQPKHKSVSDQLEPAPTPDHPEPRLLTAGRSIDGLASPKSASTSSIRAHHQKMNVSILNWIQNVENLPPQNIASPSITSGPASDLATIPIRAPDESPILWEIPGVDATVHVPIRAIDECILGNLGSSMVSTKESLPRLTRGNSGRLDLLGPIDEKISSAPLMEAKNVVLSRQNRSKGSNYTKSVHSRFMELPISQECRNTISNPTRRLNRSKVDELFSLGDDQEVLRNLMEPLAPTPAWVPSTLQPRLMEESLPPREYHQTMNQKSRGRQNKQAKGRPTPIFESRPWLASSSSIVAPGGSQHAQRADSWAQPHTSGQGSGESNVPTSGTDRALSSLPESFRSRGFSLSGGRMTARKLPLTMEISAKDRANFVTALEERLVKMAGRAKGLIGRVSLHCVLGRIVMENIHESAVNFTGSGAERACFDQHHLLRELAVFDESNVRFHPIISMNGADADRLVNVAWTSTNASNHQWTLQSTKAFFDFNCRSVQTGAKFTVEVDSQDITATFQSHNGTSIADLIYIHCPNRSWDLNFILKVTDTDYFSRKYSTFVQSIMDGLEM